MSDHSEPVKHELKKLVIGEFNTIPNGGLSYAPCPKCGNTLSERDRVGGGLACFDVTTLYYCENCGHYEIGETYWTTDY